MNTLMLVVVVLVLFVYFGGSKVPSVLRQNKELLLGAAGGLVLCSFFDLRMEGLGAGLGKDCRKDRDCNSGRCTDGVCTETHKQGVRRVENEQCHHAGMKAYACALPDMRAWWNGQCAPNTCDKP